MAGPILKTGLGIAVRESSDPNLYEFGVVWNGVFTAIAQRGKFAINADHAAWAAANPSPVAPTDGSETTG